jgi:hypothetical protein
LTPGAATGASRSFNYGSRDSGDAYVTLFSVTLTHNYYNRNNNLCPDFRVLPTPASASLMASLGLLFRDEGTGFCVLIQPNDLPRLTDYLRSHAQIVAEKPEYWTRLTFLLTMDSPLFIGITELPINTKPTQQVLYARNTQAHSSDSTIILAKGAFLDRSARHRGVGTELAVTLPENTATVTVSDISGAVVIQAPVAKPVPNDQQRYAQRASLSFADLPNDLYTIKIYDAAGKAIKSATYPRTVAYVPGTPPTMGLLDILFTQPKPGATPPKPGTRGFYPLTPVPANGSAQLSSNAAYVVPFNARGTYWEYYVVSQDPAATLSNLRIEPVTPAKVTFQTQTDPAPLPDGSVPAVLRSKTTLPLRQLQPERFRLTVRRTDSAGRTNDIVVNPLPLAPGSPVWPGPADQPMTGTSEMFVYV